MGEFHFRRWRRYDHDRLYVITTGGAELGWWDLGADEGHPSSPELMELVAVAVREWRADETEEIAPESSTVAEAPAEEPWDDLALSTPGERARAQAQTYKEAHPVKTMLQRVLAVHGDERAWRVGADGEESVAKRLERVAKRDPRWRFLHSIPVGQRDSDIDHVAIGPGGVFTLNTKNHLGKKGLGRARRALRERGAASLRSEQQARGRKGSSSAHPGVRIRRRRHGDGGDLRRQRADGQADTRRRGRHHPVSPARMAPEATPGPERGRDRGDLRGRPALHDLATYEAAALARIRLRRSKSNVDDAGVVIR